MVRRVKRRHGLAHNYHNLKIVSYERVNTIEKYESLTLKWIKTTITERSMGTDEYKKKLEIMSIEERETIDVLNKISFYRKYMDLLVISKQLELITDILFLRTSCPCILQPDSVVIKMWNYIIAILALALVIIYPYCSSFNPILRVSMAHPKAFHTKNRKCKNKGF